MNNFTIMAVDDDTEDLEILFEVVQMVDPSLIYITATSGQEAIELLKSNIHPNILFLDINMPLKNGIDTLREIRADRIYDDISIIMFSTSINETNEAYFKTLNASSQRKMNSVQELVKVVRKLITGYQVSN